MSERSEKIQKFRKRMEARVEGMCGEGRKPYTNTRQSWGSRIIDGLDALYIAWILIAIVVAIATGGAIILL